MIKINPFIALSTISLISACSNSGSLRPMTDSCSAAIYEKADKTNKASVDAAADLSAFAKAPVKGNFKAELSQIFNATFQKVPDKDSACAMLTQAYLCINDKERSSQYLEFMEGTKQCDK